MNKKKDVLYPCEEKGCDSIIDILKDKRGTDYVIVVASDKAQVDITGYDNKYNENEVLELSRKERLYFFCKKCYPFFILELQLNSEPITKEELDKIVKVPHDHN